MGVTISKFFIDRICTTVKGIKRKFEDYPDVKQDLTSEENNGCCKPETDELIKREDKISSNVESRKRLRQDESEPPLILFERLTSKITISNSASKESSSPTAYESLGSSKSVLEFLEFEGSHISKKASSETLLQVAPTTTTTTSSIFTQEIQEDVNDSKSTSPFESGNEELEIEETEDKSASLKTSPDIMMLEDLKNKLDWSTKDFRKRKVVGHGGFSKVYAAILKGTDDRKVALKYVTTSTLKKLLPVDGNDCAFMEEYNLQRSMNHINVVKGLGFYKMIRNAVMVMEYCEQGDLQDYIDYRGFKFCPQRSLRYIKQIAEGLKYLHLDAHIMHMDLKLENVLISKDDIPKITDFGFAMKLSRVNSLRKLHFKCRGGTRWYKAPELLRHCQFDSTADIWAFGCISYELVFRFHPFFTTENANNSDLNYSSKEEVSIALKRMLEASDGKFRHQTLFEQQSEEFRNFINMVLAFFFRRRATVMQLDALLESITF